MFTYEVKYLVSGAGWGVMEDTYYCKAWTKWGAWKKWLKGTKGYFHYASYEYRESYWHMRKDITWVRRARKEN